MSRSLFVFRLCKKTEGKASRAEASMAGIAYCASPSRQYAWPRFSTFTESTGMSYTFITLATPVGELKLVANGSRLAAILWENDKPDRVRLGPMREAPDNPI